MRPKRHRDDQRVSIGCRCRELGAPAEANSRLLVLCLDPEHRRQLEACPGLVLRTVGCPLQILRALDRGRPGPVLLDACPASLSCCRKLLPEARACAWLEVHQVGIARPTERPGIANTEFSTGGSGLPTSGHPTVKSTAARLEMNPRQLARLFNVAGWDPPFRELRQRHLQRALAELRSTRLPLHVIAEHVGYHDAATFARAFKRTFGYYPGQVRSLLALPNRAGIGQTGHS